MSGDLGRGAGNVHLQNSETGLRAPGSGGFPEEVALDPGPERRAGIRCFQGPERRAGGRRPGLPSEGRGQRRPQKLWAEPWPGGPRQRAATACSVPHHLGSRFDPSRSLFSSANSVPLPGRRAGFRRPAESPCGPCGPPPPDRAPPLGADFPAPSATHAGRAGGSHCGRERGAGTEGGAGCQPTLPPATPA